MFTPPRPDSSSATAQPFKRPQAPILPSSVDSTHKDREYRELTKIVALQRRLLEQKQTEIDVLKAKLDAATKELALRRRTTNLPPPETPSAPGSRKPDTPLPRLGRWALGAANSSAPPINGMTTPAFPR